MTKSQHILFFAIFLLLFAKAGAQETVMLEGQVLNDSIEQSYLHVLNLNLQRGTITNEKGIFTIPVRLRDTLYISALQYKHKEIVITEEMLSRKHISFYLENEVNELEEVNIGDLDLSGRLGEDLKKQPVEKPFDPAAAGLPVYTGPIITQEERRLYTATHSAGGIIPVDLIINGISGRTRMLKKHVRVSTMERRVQEARNLFVDSVYVRQLQIPPRLVDDFVHYVYENKEGHLAVAERNNPLALIELLQGLLPAYKMHRKVVEH